jgi:thymidylate synthase
MYATVKNLADAHELACAIIMDTHREISIQTHIDKAEFTIEYPAPMYITITDPLSEPQVSPGVLFKEKLAEGYKKQFLTLTPPRVDGKHATYTYFNRLKDYPVIDSGDCPSTCIPNEDDCRFCFAQSSMKGDGDGRGFDQITILVNKLVYDANSRRGIMVTWNPLLDAESIEPPCMDLVQVIIRDGKIMFRVVFRSQDMLSGLGENLIGCSALHQNIREQINNHPDYKGKPLETGPLTLISLIPHIYKKRDSTEFGLMRTRIYNRQMAGNWKFQYVL